LYNNLLHEDGFYILEPTLMWEFIVLVLYKNQIPIYIGKFFIAEPTGTMKPTNLFLTSSFEHIASLPGGFCYFKSSFIR
jgi:hypothetical protein